MMNFHGKCSSIGQPSHCFIDDYYLFKAHHPFSSTFVKDLITSIVLSLNISIYTCVSTSDLALCSTVPLNVYTQEITYIANPCTF